MVVGEVFDGSTVRGLAGPVSYARGVRYVAEGLVSAEAVTEERVQATVRGSRPYEVELWVEDEQAAWSCDCPAAEDGSFCKHCVAVALALDDDAAPAAPELTVMGPAGSPQDVDVAGHVSGLSRERLVEIVLAQAESDWRLRERLKAEAYAARGEGPDVASWQRRIEAAFAPYDDYVDYVDYREAAGWAAEVDGVIDALVELCDAGHADAVAVLVEHAHRQADEAVQYVDDSDGWLSDISARLAELHVRACAEGDPDPVALARRLVDLELTSELDGFHRAALTHADTLGPVGLAEYRRLLEPRWAAVAHADNSFRWSSGRFAIREALIGVALASGDPDELIAVRSRDLRSPDDYLEVARALQEAGRGDEAIEWARRGLSEHGDRSWQTPPLRELLAGLLRQRGEAGGAVELFWEAFVAAPSLDAYRRLLAETSDDALGWSARAVESLRARVRERRPADEDVRSHAVPRPAQALVQILLHEGDVDAAWDTATEFGCDDRLWLTLARAREASHPLDAIGVYEREVFTQIDRKKNDAYRSAVELLARIQRLGDAAGRPERFSDLLERVRREHRAKRNLKALLDKKGW